MSAGTLRHRVFTACAELGGEFSAGQVCALMPPGIPRYKISVELAHLAWGGRIARGRSRGYYRLKSTPVVLPELDRIMLAWAARRSPGDINESVRR